MLSPVYIVAGKELIDACRDRRALFSGACYTLMGPVVVGLVSAGVHSDAVVVAMMSVFAVVSAFVGGMNVAMDSIAGERERRSLVPLLLHPVSRFGVLLGKWLAVAVFAVAGLTINVIGFSLLVHRPVPLYLALSLVPLALLAAAAELLISTVCRNVKEAHTYLSLLVFVPMGVGMFMVFSPESGHRWFSLLPVASQQLQLEAAMQGGGASWLRILFSGCVTASMAALFLFTAAKRLEQDDAVFNG